MESSSEPAQPTSNNANLGSTAAAPLEDRTLTLLAAPMPVPDLLCGTALNPRQELSVFLGRAAHESSTTIPALAEFVAG